MIGWQRRRFDTTPGGVHCIPAQIRQVRAGGTVTGLQTLISRVQLLVTLAEPAASGSTGTSRLCRGCFPPHPASPECGCPQLHPVCCDRPEAGLFHPRPDRWRLVARVEVVPDDHDRGVELLVGGVE
jgi:hypothetical protein